MFGVFKDGGAALQFFFFAGAEFRRRDLGKAALDLGKFALAALRVFQRGLDLSRQLHARAISRANGAHARKMILAAVGVEEAKVLFRVEKRLMFMLSVDVHEQGREALERGQGHHHAGDAADAAAIGAQFARDGEQAVLAGRAQFRGHFLRARAIGDVKKRLHGSLVRAGAQKFPPGARAKRQRQAVHDDGLARARFAGKHIEALRKLDGEPLDEGDIADGDLQKHGCASLSFDERVEAADDALDRLFRARDDQNGIVPGDGAQELGPLERINGLGRRLCAGGDGLDDDEVDGALDGHHRLRQYADKTLAHALFRALGGGVLVAAVFREHFQKPQLLDVARDGCLRDLHAAGF